MIPSPHLVLLLWMCCLTHSFQTVCPWVEFSHGLMHLFFSSGTWSIPLRGDYILSILYMGNLIYSPTFSIFIYRLDVSFTLNPQPWPLINQPPLNYLCAQGPHQWHLISYIYHILHELTPLTETTHHYMRRWSHLLGWPMTVPVWDRIWSSIFKTSKCVTQGETSNKILMFWYKSPDVIHKYDPSVSLRCWRCGTDTGSLLFFGNVPWYNPFGMMWAYLYRRWWMCPFRYIP